MKIILESAHHVPPPYSYKLIVDAEIHQNELLIDVNWTFTERDNLSAAEILDEGFEPDGDFTRKGKLPLNWVQYLKSLPSDLQKSSKPALAGDVQVSIFNDQGMLIPTIPEGWILFTQELFQASLELAQVELPLTLQIHSHVNQVKSEGELHVSFQQLEGKIHWKGNEQTEVLEWQKCQSLMALFFEGDETADPVKKPQFENSIAFSADNKHWLVYGKSYHHIENEWVGKVLGNLGLK